MASLRTRSIVGWTQGLRPGLTYAAPSGLDPGLDPGETGPSPFADNEVLVERDACVPMSLVFVADVERLAAMIDD